jgi:uncharacterized protein
MKIIFDTNILISAVIAHGCPKDIFALAIEKADIVLSEYILKELAEKLHKKIKFPASEIKLICEFLRKAAIMVNPSQNASISCSDINDIPILCLALESKADYLVTGDKVLLKKKKISNTMIVTARDMLRYM